jgi:N-acetylmuramoyl-L-alanine amidase
MKLRHMSLFRTWLFWSLILVWATPMAVAAPSAVVNEMRVAKHQDHTRLVIDISEKVDINVFTLADPYRVVIDFPEVGWRIDPAAAKQNVGLMKGFRYGLFRPGRSRMVIDLTGPSALANKFLLPPEGQRRYRLVLDLVPTDRASYLKTAGWPDAAPLEAPSVLEEPPVDPGAEKQRNAKRVIVIDPGHGGVDPGATGVSGVQEKDLVLSVAGTLRSALEATGKYKVVMTRDTDIFLSLKARVAAGRREKADLFISVHADSAPNSGARGASVYTLSERASDREAEALARSENQSDVIAGVDLTKESDIVTSILIDLAQRETKNSSVKFAQALVPELQRVGGVTQKSHRFAGFRVLKAPDVPSVLIELGYLSSTHDESAMKSRRWRANMAAAITRAVDAYFKQSRSEQKAEAGQ